jgi:endonuclease/exonuclease/phosphatase family metal-dependent hydrolase
MRSATILLVILSTLSACGSTGSADRQQLTAANLNLLHGLFCPSESDHCRLPERVDLLLEWVVDSACPDIITLQEIFDESEVLVKTGLLGACPFDYQAIRAGGWPNVDDQMVLSRYPIIRDDLKILHPDFRSVLYTRIDHPLGKLDVFSTHLASGSDGGDTACDQDCPPACSTAGAQTLRDCQAVELAAYVGSIRDSQALVLVTGDFNAVPDSFVYRQFADQGWIDASYYAGNPECAPHNGVGCTSGRADQDLSGLESKELGQNERIDYIFLGLPGWGEWTIDPPADPDTDGIGTGMFAGRPNPFGSDCGASPLPVCWPSDHNGIQIDLNRH